MVWIKKNLIIFNLLFFSLHLFSQSDIKSYINDSIKWNLVYGRIKGNENNNLSELVLKTNLPDSLKKCFFKLPNKQLILFLKDSATCWATNLLLYEKYREYPGHYVKRIKTRHEWEDQGLKSFDIKYWIKKLTPLKKK